MTLGYQARALLRGLDRTGEPALLRGVDAGRVNLARNVSDYAGQLGTANDNMSVRYTVVTISKAFAPRVGDALVFVDDLGVAIPGEAYVLDRLAGDNGVTVRFIVSTAP
jgi:hypothetical protein